MDRTDGGTWYETCSTSELFVLLTVVSQDVFTQHQRGENAVVVCEMFVFCREFFFCAWQVRGAVGCTRCCRIGSRGSWQTRPAITRLLKLRNWSRKLKSWKLCLSSPIGDSLYIALIILTSLVWYWSAILGWFFHIVLAVWSSIYPQQSASCYGMTLPWKMPPPPSDGMWYLTMLSEVWC